MEELYQRIKASTYDELAVHKELCVGIKSRREAIHQWLNDNGLKFIDSSVSTSTYIVQPLQVKVCTIKQDQANNIPDIKVIKPTITPNIINQHVIAVAHSDDHERKCSTLLPANNTEKLIAKPLLWTIQDTVDNLPSSTFHNIMFSAANCKQLSVQVRYMSLMYSLMYFTKHRNHLCLGVARSPTLFLMLCLCYDTQPPRSFYTMTQSQVFDPGIIITRP